MLPVSLAVLSAPAYADLVWPALYLEMRLFSWWAVFLGFAIECFFISYLFKAKWERTLLYTAFANAVSSLMGIPLLPLAGLAWEAFPGLIIYKALGIGTFNPISWGATFFFACVINAAAEGLIYKHIFKVDFAFKSKSFLWLILANAFSVGVAAVSLIVRPIQ